MRYNARMVGMLGESVFQTQYMCGGKFEGVNMGSPLVSDAVTRVKESYFAALCSFERIHVLAL